jgi:YebC/PmpR family DNA-binding regulatory protein
MAGHSHFRNIKRKKEATDQKRALVFSKISHLIISAVREKGKDPQSNSSLRLAIEKAKEADMPKENIERAIKRGAGEGDNGKLESFLFEAYGIDDAAFIIEGTTDNKNRILGEIKEILKKHNGKLADPGSVRWLFEQKGVIEIENIDENLSLLAIENGAEEIGEKDGSFLLYTSLVNTEKLKSFFLAQNISIISSSSGWVPKMKLGVDMGKNSALIEALQNLEDVESLYTNL